MARDRETTREIRKQSIQSSIRSAKEISELPKNKDWKTEGRYCNEVMEHVIRICERYGLLPTMSHLASALGVPKGVLDDVRLGFVTVNPDVADVVNLYYQLCENATVASTLDGGANNIAGIFMLKSQYGYKEEPREVVVTHNKLLGERKDPAAIAARYAEAVIDAKPDDVTEAPVTEEYDF